MWSLLGSYVCFITTRLTTVDRFITVILYNLLIPIYCYLRGASLARLTASVTYILTLTLTLCTVLCRFLNTHLWQVSLVSRSWSLIDARDLQLGLLLQCIRQSNGSIFRDRSMLNSRVTLYRNKLSCRHKTQWCEIVYLCYIKALTLLLEWQIF